MNAVKTYVSLAVVCLGMGLWALQGRPVAAQAIFEAGYVVSLEGDTLRGQIDNREWIRNPEEIRFRIDEAERIRTFTPHQLSAFYVSGELYERRVVRIDEMSLRAGELVKQGPSARTDTVFLAVLVKGKLSLYAYRDERMHFYLEDRTGLQELIHHEYKTLRGRTTYQITEQLYQNQVVHVAALNCPDVEVEGISYLLPAVKQFVEACNRRSAPGSVRFVRETRQTVLRHELFVGASRTELALGLSGGGISFSPSRAPTFGYALAFERGGARGRRTVLLGLQLRSFEMQSPERYRSIRDLSIQAHYLRASVGYRHQLWAGALRPSVETDLTVSTPLRYQAEGKRRRGWPPVEETVAFLPANRVKPGVALGVGLAYRQLRAAWKVERTITLSSAEFALPVFTQFTLGYAF